MILTLTCLQSINQHERLCLSATEITLTSKNTEVSCSLDGPVLFLGRTAPREGNAVTQPNAIGRLMYILHLKETTTQSVSLAAGGRLGADRAALHFSLLPSPPPLKKMMTCSIFKITIIKAITFFSFFLFFLGIDAITASGTVGEAGELGEGAGVLEHVVAHLAHTAWVGAAERGDEDVATLVV